MANLSLAETRSGEQLLNNLLCFAHRVSFLPPPPSSPPPATPLPLLHCFSSSSFTTSRYVWKTSDGTNRLLESLKEFESFCKAVQNIPHLQIKLLFTKEDLFEKLLCKVPLSTGFPNYNGMFSNTLSSISVFMSCCLTSWLSC